MTNERNIRGLVFPVGTKLYFKPKKRWLVYGTIVNIITEKTIIYTLYNKSNSRNNKYFEELRNNIHLWTNQGLLKIKNE